MKLEKGILRFFYKAVMFCYKKMHLWKIPIPGRDTVKEDLKQIYPGENQRERITDYYVTKLTLSVIVLLAGILLLLIRHYGWKDVNAIDQQWMYRGTEEEGMKKHNITGRVEGGDKYSFQIEVAPRRYTEEELQNIYQQFEENLPELILEGNESLNNVKGNLNMLEKYDNFPFFVEWKSEFPEVIDENGNVHPRSENIEVFLEVEIYYEEFSRKTGFVVTVAKQEENEKSRLLEMLQTAQEEDPENERFQLPQEIDGRTVSWTENSHSTGWQIFIGTLLTAVAIFFLKDSDLHGQAEKKKRGERRDYPEILQKLMLYLETGVTVRTAFCHIADDYEKDKKKGGRKLEAYEGVLVAVREIRMGIPEATAYENFGRRTGVREYIRLSTLLTQNLKKGSLALLKQLKEEVRVAEEMRLQNARKLSEEASTKLLLPMVMLLVIVMAMIMIPAFSNVGV